jgi:SAM-dependent methyltransferase
MAEPCATQPLALNEESEVAAKNLLTEHFSPIYKDRTPDYVGTLLTTEHYLDRFRHLMNVIQCKSFQAEDDILVSGCGAGSEMFVAKQVGFGSVFGVEVEEFWIEVCKLRLQHLEDIHPQYYEGDYLPYENDQFRVIASGHVIEHTKNPYLYLQECLRVLAPGGYLSLEFPSRYHTKELHTGLVSFEWLPTPLRNAVIRALSSKLSPITQKAKEGYAAIVATDLKQISMSGTRHMLDQSGVSYSILSCVTILPGIIRCVIQKTGSR